MFVCCSTFFHAVSASDAAVINCMAPLCAGLPKRSMNQSFINCLATPHYHRGVLPSIYFSTFLAAALGLGAGLGAELAQAQAEHDSVRKEVQSGKLKPLAEIMAMVQQRHAGRVVDIDLERGLDGRRWYKIKLLNGQRTTLYIDAATGEEIPKPDAAAAALLPMSSVVRSMLSSHPSVVLEVELEGSQGPAPYYEFKLLGKDSRELLLRVDALSGRMLTEPPLSPAEALRLQPLDKILLALEQRYKARTVEAELKNKPGKPRYYEVDLLLDSGRGLEVLVNATTGEVIAEDALR